MYKVFIHDCCVKFVKNPDDDLLQRENCVLIHVDENQDFQIIRDMIQENPGLESVYLFSESIEEVWKVFTSGHQVVEAAGGLVRNSNGDTLCIFRRGMWDLPKGKLDPGETVEEAALREVEEECGINRLSINKQLATSWHTYEMDGQHVLKPTYWFEMEYDGDGQLTPQAEEDIAEVKWVPSEELTSIRNASFKSLAYLFDEAINRPKP